MVTIELKASGIAATARATAKRRESITMFITSGFSPPLKPLNIERPKTTTHTTMMISASFLEKASRLFCRGVFFSFASFMREAILPISVFIPVPVTATRALP